MVTSLKKQLTRQTKSGFTLVEVMVSLSLFMVVVTVSVGTMIVLIDANKKAQTVESLINNVSISVDSMTREIRKGYNYQCKEEGGAFSTLDMTDNSATPSDCSSASTPGDALAFTESGGSLTGDCSSGNRVAYRHYVDSEGNGSIQRNVCGDPTNPDNWRSVTAPDINITSLEFRVDHTDPADDFPPVVYVLVTGEAGEYDVVATDFQIQTSVTQRLLDTNN